MPIHAANGLVYYDLSHPLAHGVPQWPSSANLNIRTLKFHAKDGVMVQQYEVITPDVLENARPRIEPGDILMINTGMHNKLADTDEYYAYSPGLYKEAGEWIVNRGVKMLGIDTNALDHPLGTKLADHGPGP